MTIDDDIFNGLLRAFENVYAERDIYQAIAEDVPNWKEAFDWWMHPDSEHRRAVAQAFATVKERLIAHQKCEDILPELKTGFLQ